MRQNVAVHHYESGVRNAVDCRLRGVRDKRREHAQAAHSLLRGLLHLSVWR